VLSYGDFSTLSFHATKAFNTFEGGAIISGRAAGKAKVDSLRNFGIADEVSIPAVGGNAKMSEFNAALGLVQLRHFEHVRAERKKVDEFYRNALANIEGIEALAIPDEVEPNYSYFPVLVKPSFRLSRDDLYEELKRKNIYSRRYFYPLLSTLPMYKHLSSAASSNLPIASTAAEEILCLPIYPDLSEDQQQRIVDALWKI
jgi:dTDP-4-amino-4,6-dideoxygalactose transaminase